MKYKVGDKVRIKSLDWYEKNKDEDRIVELSTHIFTPGMSQFCGKVMTIEDVFDNGIYYMEQIDYDWTDEMIEGLVEEEEIEFTEEDKFWCDIMSESDPTTYVLPQGYIFKDENGNVINAMKIVLEKKKPKYPKTYEECCAELNYLPFTDEVVGYKWDLIQTFQQLLICRDAYWKIAGEEMGLGEPWEPDYDSGADKFGIICLDGVVQESNPTTNWERHLNKILDFPTKEMRDAFKQNFDPDIEICKEFL